MENIWVLVANASVATLYNFIPKQKKPTLTVLKQFEHPDSRKKDENLVSDREGRYANQATGGTGNFVEANDPHQYQGFVFARELFHYLEQNRVKQAFLSLILVAPPEFMGYLRQCIDDHPFKKVDLKEIVKDYTKLSVLELIKALELETH